MLKEYRISKKANLFNFEVKLNIVRRKLTVTNKGACE